MKCLIQHLWSWLLKWFVQYFVLQEHFIFEFTEKLFITFYFITINSQGLKAISDVWENMPLELVPHRQGIYRLKTVEDVLQALEDHQVQLGTVKSKK